MNIEAVYNSLLIPSDSLVADMAKIDGDIIILGVGGKMGPALARVAKQAVDKAGLNKKIIGVARFSEPGLQQQLETEGIETISADLLNDDQLDTLPNVTNVLYLAGTKFGTSGNESFTWAMNAYLPGRVAQKFRQSSIVVFSTGNVYPLVPVVSGGATEDLAPGPVGEYGQSCLGRERIFQYFSSKNNTPVLIYRLNYANDVTYGVLMEIAKAVMENKPVDLAMGTASVIWQGDANEIAIRSLLHCTVPAKILNVTGPETVSLRWLATQFGKMLNKTPLFVNEEQSTSILSNAAESFRLFGYPKITLMLMMEIILEWLKEGGKTTPTEESVRRAMAIQLIINRELGTAKNENPNQGSFLTEELTDLVEDAVMIEFHRLAERGGVLGAMERMYQRNKIQEESLYYETLKHTGEFPIVGVNTFLNKKGSPTILPSEVIRSTTAEKDFQVNTLQAFHRRHAAKSADMLVRLQQVAVSNGNLFAELMETVKCCSLGQITNALYNVGGQYRRNM